MACRIQAKPAGQIVEHILDSPALGLECGDQLQHQQRGGDAVLVVDGLGVAAVTQCLLVAEPKIGHLGNPLEPGQRGGVAKSGIGRDAFQQGVRDDRLGVDTLDRLAFPTSPFGDPPPQQGTHLVAGEHPVIDGSPDADRAPVGVGIVGDDHVGALGAGVGQGEVHGAGFFGVGKVHRREAGVGVELLGNFDRGRETGSGHRPHEHLTTHAVHGGVDRRHFPRPVTE